MLLLENQPAVGAFQGQAPNEAFIKIIGALINIAHHITPCNNKRASISFEIEALWCARRDLNPHVLANTGT